MTSRTAGNEVGPSMLPGDKWHNPSNKDDGLQQYGLSTQETMLAVLSADRIESEEVLLHLRGNDESKPFISL